MLAIDQIKGLIEESKSFVLEAGAGSGKTYTLIQTINYLLESKGDWLIRNHKRIVCITYTNVAKNEVIDRLENNPLVLVLTIHEFLWDCIKPFNKQLIIELDKLNTKMHGEKPDKFELGLAKRISEVSYNDSGYRDFEKGKLHHDDVISLSHQMLLNYPHLTKIVADRYPYILIDEYQDTAPETIEGILNGVHERHKSNVVVGFYGDSYQKIYDEGVGSLQCFVEDGKISLVTKKENYRSSRNVIKLLNNVRDNIVQEIPEGIPCREGSIKFVNYTNYPVKSKGQKVKEYEQSLLPTKAANYDRIISELEGEGWNFGEGSEDKILIIANSRVSQRGGFGNLYKTFASRFPMDVKERLLKRENPFVSYFLGNLDKKTSRERETGIEHLMSFWSNKDYNNVIRFLKRNGNWKSLERHTDKKIIEDKLDELLELRESKTIGEVFEYCKTKNISSISPSIERFIQKIDQDIATIDDEELKKKIIKDKTFFNSLMALPYIEMINAFKHIQDQTVFSTKHGTKGEEYRNVLVVIDDTSWKAQYNFENFFNGSEEKPERELRTKNLFYVSCSRAKENLVVLALSTMGTEAMTTIESWFGFDNVIVV